MDEDQVNKLGEKMKQVYPDVVEEAGAEASAAGRQLRTKRDQVASVARRDAGTLEAQVASFVKERPITALLAAVSAGYVLSRLTPRG